MMAHKNAVELRLTGRPEDIKQMVERVRVFFVVLNEAPYPQPDKKKPGHVVKYMTVVHPGDAHKGGEQ